ncbi:hypothetical protein [Streptomyces sp. 3211.6]|uniref:hypothetical protein n=1 Tax=Streptomyces sp. 3211.6 TaxID=1938845 RepID=UPI00131E8231|nr:hypothetical protein [Streptomyces sp. 3211.6]
MNRLFRMAVLSLLVALPVLFAGGVVPGPATASAPASAPAADEHVDLAAPGNWAWD